MRKMKEAHPDEEVDIVQTKPSSFPVNTTPKSNNLLIVLLIAVSFFAGYLLFKVQSLEKQTTNVAAAPAGNGQQPPPQPTPDLSAIPKITDKDHIRGDKSADVLLVEYSDYECPFCKRFHPTMQQVMKEYGNKVAWIYRHYPLDFHQNAQKEAEAAECVNELGGNEKFWEYSDKIFEKTAAGGTGLALDQLAPLAQEVGVNGVQFQSCLDSGKYAQHVKDDMTGGAKAGISGTPGTIIIGKNGKRELIPGALPYEQVKPLIDKVLN